LTFCADMSSHYLADIAPVAGSYGRSLQVAAAESRRLKHRGGYGISARWLVRPAIFCKYLSTGLIHSVEGAVHNLLTADNAVGRVPP